MIILTEIRRISVVFFSQSFLIATILVLKFFPSLMSIDYVISMFKHHILENLVDKHILVTYKMKFL